MTPQQQEASRPAVATPSTATPAECPVRPGDPCSLCHPGSRGPETCGLVYLVMNDPELRAQLKQLRRERRPAA